MLTKNAQGHIYACAENAPIEGNGCIIQDCSNSRKIDDNLHLALREAMDGSERYWLHGVEGEAFAIFIEVLSEHGYEIVKRSENNAKD